MRQANPQSIAPKGHFAFPRALLSRRRRSGGNRAFRFATLCEFLANLAVKLSTDTARFATEDAKLRKKFGVLCLLTVSAVVSAQSQTNSPSVSKVEPYSWWADHTINPVRLLVRGKNLAGARVIGTRAGTKTAGVRVNTAGTYLFVNVLVSPAARPGSYPLKLITSQGTTTIPFQLEKPLAANSRFQGITADDVIYLIMPDRFARRRSFKQYSVRRSGRRH